MTPIASVATPRTSTTASPALVAAAAGAGGPPEPRDERPELLDLDIDVAPHRDRAPERGAGAGEGIVRGIGRRHARSHDDAAQVWPFFSASFRQ